MEISINPNTQIGEVKKVFHDEFNNCRLEFYHQAHASTDKVDPKEQVQDHFMLKDLIKAPYHLHFEFDKTIKIGDLENVFERDFGLHVQVFRKYGDAWLKTTLTDHWTLQMAEIAAKELEELKHKNEPKEYDIEN